MGSMLDVLGALVVSGMILVSIFTAMFNVNFLGHDLNMEYTLIKDSERLITGIDSLYLAKVGSGMGTSTGILEATPTKFRFEYKVSPQSTITEEICIIQEAQTENGFPFKIYRNNNTELGPFWLADSLKLTYYSKSGNVTTFIDSIRSIEVKMNFTYDYLSSGLRGRNIRYETVFWRYFKNLYLM